MLSSNALKMTGLAAAFGVATLLTTPASTAHAGQFALVDENSTAGINTESQDGMFAWEVDGVSNLFQQWFWYRVGSTGPETSLDTLTIDQEGTTDTDFDGDHDNLFVRYLDSANDLTFEINYRLEGGADLSGAADIAEQIDITNNSGADIELQFFQYADFDINDTFDDDTVTLTAASQVMQSDGSAFLSETVLTSADRAELAFFDDTLAKLNDGDADDLDIDLSSTTFPQSVGPGDVTWAFQWDIDLVAGDSFSISKDKKIDFEGLIPEPASFVLLGLGVLAMLRRPR